MDPCNENILFDVPPRLVASAFSINAKRSVLGRHPMEHFTSLAKMACVCQKRDTFLFKARASSISRRGPQLPKTKAIRKLKTLWGNWWRISSASTRSASSASCNYFPVSRDATVVFFFNYTASKYLFDFFRLYGQRVFLRSLRHEKRMTAWNEAVPEHHRKNVLARVSFDDRNGRRIRRKIINVDTH